MRRNTIFALSGALLSLLLVACCCIGVALYWDGYYLPNKPCRPITYPDGQTTTTSFSTTTSDSLDAVLQYYDRQLNVQPYPGDMGQWIRVEQADSEYLYSCASVDINGLTTETGCVYISSQGEATYIETELLRSEGGNNQCSRFKP